MQKVGIQVPIEKKNPYQVDVVQPLKTSILLLQATGPDPDVTQHYLQAILDGYLLYKKDTHISSSQDVSGFNSRMNLWGKSGFESRGALAD